MDRYCMCARCRQMVLENAAVGAARGECHSKERKTRKRRAQIVVAFAAPLEKSAEKLGYFSPLIRFPIGRAKSSCSELLQPAHVAAQRPAATLAS